MPRVSVIIGIYNCASTLQEALDSLYAQTYKDFEIILCDDGSTDDTYAVAKENQEKHDNIVLLRNEENRGLNITLNRCLEYARGEFVARMDGDDRCAPDRFEKEVEFLEGHPEFAIVTTPMFHFDDEGIFAQGVGYGEPDVSCFAKGSPFNHAPCMVRREAYKKVGGYSVDPRLLRVEDYHLWIKMYAAGYRGYVLEEPLYYMRDDRNAASRRSWRNRLNEIHARKIAITKLGLPFYNYVHCLRPIIAGILPLRVYSLLHKMKNRVPKK